MGQRLGELLMPELPEVEVVRQKLLPSVVNRKISHIVTDKPSYFFLTPPATLKKRLPERTIVSLERHGKYLFVGLDDESRLILHQGMTGQIYLTPRSATVEPHTHLQIAFDDTGPTVVFRDVRKFGKVFYVPKGQTHPRLTNLGPDALNTSGDWLFRTSRKRSVAIKTWLLDQTVLAGIGNIYADEALFQMGIRPTRQAHSLTKDTCEQLAAAIRQTLKRAIELGGSSIRDYIHPDQTRGSYQTERKVYGRKGLPCYRCGNPIVRIQLQQRSSHFCPTCQK